MTRFELELGARYQGGGRTRFTVWAPERRAVEVALRAPGGGVRWLPLQKGAGGYFSGAHPAQPGDRYLFRLDGDGEFPDPAARFLPEGPHGPAEIVDPSTFRWTDGSWRGLKLKGQVLYEVHVGAYTPEGTYAALAAQLPALQDLGVTCLELMPVNTFPGRFNWGYDGVGLYAPNPTYGRPDDLRRLVDEAHRLGLGVILDVVYNHLGPDGCYLRQFSPRYFTDRYPAEWGEPLRFEGQDARPVRDFFAHNAAYWISEFHLDGLRLDATQSLHDSSARHVVAEIASAARAAAGGREILVIAENEPQDLKMVLPEEDGGHGCDALWVDDFHHSARVALGGGAEAYLQDYRGSAQELLSCALRNALYQGQWYAWQGKRRGTPLWRARPEQAVFFLQNHDQVANTLRGERLQITGGERRARALTTYLLLLPQTPLLFMGQESFTSRPFLYFVDHASADLAEAVRRGREKYLSQFPSAARAIRDEGHRPLAGEEAFLASRLDPGERDRPPHAHAWALHRALLRLRREDPRFSRQDPTRMAGAVLGQDALALRFFGESGAGDCLLLLNLGPTLSLAPCPEPLVAPRPGARWRLILSSEEVRFGGLGATFPTGEAAPFVVPGQAAVVLDTEEVPVREHDPAVA
jgi:maltooligosyltrehalose trehalohydrolase